MAIGTAKMHIGSAQGAVIASGSAADFFLPSTSPCHVPSGPLRLVATPWISKWGVIHWCLLLS